MSPWPHIRTLHPHPHSAPTTTHIIRSQHPPTIPAQGWIGHRTGSLSITFPIPTVVLHGHCLIILNRSRPWLLSRPTSIAELHRLSILLRRLIVALRERLRPACMPGSLPNRLKPGQSITHLLTLPIHSLTIQALWPTWLHLLHRLHWITRVGRRATIRPHRLAIITCRITR